MDEIHDFLDAVTAAVGRSTEYVIVAHARKEVSNEDAAC